MSHSFKKHPYVTCGKDRQMKKMFNRKIRHSRDENPYRDYRKRNESWDICDFKRHTDVPKEQMTDYEKKRFLRK